LKNVRNVGTGRTGKMDDRFRFRVYDKDAKKVHECGNDIHDSLEFDDDGVLYYYNLKNGCGSPETYVLMQCTGLRDKNGKLIYEGDVLGLPNQQNGGKVVVRWENAGAEFWAVDRDNYGGNAKSFLSWAAIAGREQVIILGNIYENPDLLKG
jgi:uncharacterized phage protein (TIGR01671 family)